MPKSRCSVTICGATCQVTVSIPSRAWIRMVMTTATVSANTLPPPTARERFWRKARTARINVTTTSDAAR